MESRHVSVSDGIGRFLSLLAILVALGSAVFLYQNNQSLKTELATITSNQKDPEVFQTQVANWDEKLTAVLNEFVKRNGAALEEFDLAREARNRIVAAATEETTSGLSREEVEQIVSQRLELATAEPELRPAMAVARPTGEDEFVPAIVRNVGMVDAEIKAARFLPKPDSQFMVKTPHDSSPDAVVIEFDPSHNETTKTAGAHKFYSRSYIRLEQVVPAKKSVQVSVEIHANGRHLDWGMTGDLELEYQDGETVLIPNAKAVFVADKEETI